MGLGEVGCRRPEHHRTLGEVVVHRPCRPLGVLHPAEHDDHLVALGGAQRVHARPPLREALATFEHLGAVPWADRAAVELEATGETALRRGAGVIAALTPQERQIATLLAQGRTSREAAVALFLSPKTVEYHLRHVYIKLGIHSREDLARVLADG